VRAFLVAAQTNVATPSARSIRQRVDELMRFIDAQRMPRKYEPGWFEDDDAVESISPLEKRLGARPTFRRRRMRTTPCGQVPGVPPNQYERPGMPLSGIPEANRIGLD
jgi:hypothetical protein